ncbi:MAG: ABC transporter permease [Anaerolineae bacterium]|nr:ABC transporter permease [Anaerolineae bacterium]
MGSMVRQLPLEARWGLAVLLVIVVLSAVVPLLSRYDPLTSSDDPLLPPSAAHLFGTDQLGRDVFVRTFAAAQLDIVLAFIGVAIPLLIGTFLGAIVGTARNPLIGGIWTVIVDSINAFPLIVLVIAVVAVIGSGVEGILVALAMTNWARYGKLARARALALREADFVHATYVLGYSQGRVLLRHIVPNIYSTTLAYGLSDFVIVIVTIAGMSFLGVGVRPPTPEWGAMMNEGKLFLTSEWWLTVFPGLALSITAIGVALLAEGVMRLTRGED